MSTLAVAVTSLIVAAGLVVGSPARVLPDWSAASPCPAGYSLFDTEEVGMAPASGVEADGLTCELAG